MSLIKLIRQQLGLSVTPANNFTLDASADNGTMKLARGNAGSTTQDLIVVDAAGNVKMPTKVGFFAHCNNVDQSIQIPTGVITKSICQYVAHQVGSGYNASTGVFTAPVSGVYTFSGAFSHHANTTAPTKSLRFYLSTGEQYLIDYLIGDTGTGRMFGSITIYLSAGTTVDMRFYQDSGIPMWQGWNPAILYFSGYLIG
jgi:hypothetical protein